MSYEEKVLILYLSLNTTESLQPINASYGYSVRCNIRNFLKMAETCGACDQRATARGQEEINKFHET